MNAMTNIIGGLLETIIMSTEKSKGLSYEEWREKDSPGWFLSKEKEESRFDRYLEYLKENGYKYDELND